MNACLCEGKVKQRNYFCLKGKYLKGDSLAFFKDVRVTGKAAVASLYPPQCNDSESWWRTGRWQFWKSHRYCRCLSCQTGSQTRCPSARLPEQSHQISPSNFQRNGERTEWARREGLESILGWRWNLQPALSGMGPLTPWFLSGGKTPNLPCLGGKRHSPSLNSAPMSVGL